MAVVVFFFNCYYFYLFVCRHSALPPRIDLCISRTSLSLPWRWVNKCQTTRENTTEEDGNSDRQSEFMNERNQEIIILRFQLSLRSAVQNDTTNLVCSTLLVVLVDISLVLSHYTHWLTKTRFNLHKISVNINWVWTWWWPELLPNHFCIIHSSNVCAWIN